jgi:hypothetical protein
MSIITFRTHDNFVTFQSMAEGMWCTARDDNDLARQAALDGLISGLEASWQAIEPVPEYPITLPVVDAEIARDVLDNCLDNSDLHAGDEGTPSRPATSRSNDVQTTNNDRSLNNADAKTGRSRNQKAGALSRRHD